jgi:putative phosphoesterase
MLIGVIADTHGYVDARLAVAFTGVEAILHAGDVGGLQVLEDLRAIAPVHAVRGNNDEKLGGLGLPLHLDLELAGTRIQVVHQLPHARPPAGTRVLVYGHSHAVRIEEVAGVLHLNPGAAGRAGFHRVQSVALLRIEGAALDARCIELGPRELIARRPRR